MRTTTTATGETMIVIGTIMITTMTTDHVRKARRFGGRSALVRRHNRRVASSPLATFTAKLGCRGYRRARMRRLPAWSAFWSTGATWTTASRH